MAVNKTQAAEMSLIFLILESNSGEIKSQTFSMAVFINSAAKTMAIANKISAHSIGLRLTKKPRKHANKAAIKWIRKLCSSNHIKRNPLMA